MLRENLTEILGRIATAARRANRSPGEIKLVAVSKRVAPQMMAEAFDLGQHVFGESYVQEAMEKIPYLRDIRGKSDIVFHFIGKLQSNKSKKAAELFDVIETVDNVKLAGILEKHLAELNKPLSGYVQVNLGREARKSGIMPEKCSELLAEVSGYQYLRIDGLMAIPPYCSNPEDVRPYFRQLRLLSEELRGRGLLGKHGPSELSMGMSGDFEVAIEEGATVVRIGTAIFGQRDP